ncbi:Bidirectional sugar transporter SWEET17 [Linum grandiflorum]
MMLYVCIYMGTFWRIIKKGSTEEFESLPYICTLLNASLWTYYGSIKPGAYLVATVNGFGILVEIVYVALFLCYAPTKMKAKTGAMVGVLNVGFLGAAVVATWVALEGEARINAIGFLSSALNIVMYGSPLAAMKTVITTKSVEYMPFFLSFFLFLNGGIWTVYALLTKDLFLGVSIRVCLNLTPQLTSISYIIFVEENITSAHKFSPPSWYSK